MSSPASPPRGDTVQEATERETGHRPFAMSRDDRCDVSHLAPLRSSSSRNAAIVAAVGLRPDEQLLARDLRKDVAVAPGRDGARGRPGVDPGEPIEAVLELPIWRSGTLRHPLPGRSRTRPERHLPLERPCHTSPAAPSRDRCRPRRGDDIGVRGRGRRGRVGGRRRRAVGSDRPGSAIRTGLPSAAGVRSRDPTVRTSALWSGSTFAKEASNAATPSAPRGVAPETKTTVSTRVTPSERRAASAW